MTATLKWREKGTNWHTELFSVVVNVVEELVGNKEPCRRRKRGFDLGIA
jgi:hypothetical protein